MKQQPEASGSGHLGSSEDNVAAGKLKCGDSREAAGRFLLAEHESRKEALSNRDGGQMVEGRRGVP